jgi:hypothetical protein
MVSIRCESATCSCDSEVQFHAGTSSYCSEYCAFTEPDAAAPCECTHSGCEDLDHEPQARYPAAPIETSGPRPGNGRSPR